MGECAHSTHLTIGMANLHSHFNARSSACGGRTNRSTYNVAEFSASAWVPLAHEFGSVYAYRAVGQGMLLLVG